MLTAFALSALMSTAAQTSGAPADPIVLDVSVRPVDAENIPANARLVALPNLAGPVGLSGTMTVNGGAAEDLILVERCTVDGDMCLYEADLEGLSDGDGAAVTLSGDASRSYAYSVGAEDLDPPTPEFDPERPEMLVFLAPGGEVDSFSFYFEIADLSLDVDLAMYEIEQIMDDGTREPLHFGVLNNGRRDASANVRVSGTEGEACVALLLKDLAGNTTTVEGDAYCRLLDRDEADDEVQLLRETGEISLEELLLGCNHMGTEKSAPVGFGALMLLGMALGARRRRRQS